MSKPVRVEIVGRSEFWRKAVVVEWRHRYPGRALVVGADGFYRIEPEWLEDIEAVARRCFSEIAVAPQDPSRLSWLRRLARRGRS